VDWWKKGEYYWCKQYERPLLLDKIRIGIYGIIIRDGAILMTHTRSGTKDVLNFPGGGVEINEGFADALKRECFEELGMHVEIERFLYSSKQLYLHEDFPQFRMFNLYFLIKPTAQKEEGELEVEWYPIDSLPLQQMLPIDQEFASVIDEIFVQ
jgi:ADP-ribose pyrophosphatase YjhB (NUDIX family)